MKKLLKFLIFYPLLLLILGEVVIAGYYYYNDFAHFSSGALTLKKQLKSEHYKPFPKSIEKRIISTLEWRIRQKPTFFKDHPIMRMNTTLINHFIKSKPLKRYGGWITGEVARAIFREEKLSRKSLHHKVLLSGLEGGVKSKFTQRQLLDFYLHETYFGAKNPGISYSAQHFFKKKVRELTKPELGKILMFQLYPKSVKQFTPKHAQKLKQFIKHWK